METTKLNNWYMGSFIDVIYDREIGRHVPDISRALKTLDHIKTFYDIEKTLKEGQQCY